MKLNGSNKVLQQKLPKFTIEIRSENFWQVSIVPYISKVTVTETLIYNQLILYFARNKTILTILQQF